MKILRTIDDIKTYAKSQKDAGKTIGLVPTMGALHEGHLTLMRTAKENCDVVIASVFVNPVQFGPNEDYDAYPRQFEADCKKLESVNVDAVFHPEPSAMYPQGYCTYVNVEGDFTHKLCGGQRPGHFRGVATVVTKLMNLSRADKAFFGQKDAQQLATIRRFVRDLNFGLEIVPCPIVREADGLAKSSRNTYLSPAERKAALILSKSLALGKKAVDEGERDASKVVSIITESLQTEPLARIDYVEVVDFENIQRVETISGETLVAIAVYIGKTRLIDNFIVNA